jgi:[acyl-carrier-protein] S-malonyltransferase
MSMKSLGFVFPGQGSQSVGMLADVAQEFPEIESTFSEASTALGYDLWKLVHEGPAEELDKTAHTQPALLTASYAVWRIIQAKTDLKPALLAGHSLGEYTALVCSNAISFTDAVKLVAMRGQYMQEAVPVGKGGLAAIVGLDDLAVKALCEQVVQPGEVLTPANFNSPGQVVIGGDIAAVERALIAAKESGARLAKLLPVSAPSHCALMAPAAEKLAATLKTISIQTPQIPVLNNVDVAIYQTPDSIRDGLVRQLFMPVRWVETIEYFVKAGVTEIVECGPGKVLSGLNKRIAAQAQLMTTADIINLQTLLKHPAKV